MNDFIRLLLSPAALLYESAVRMRNAAFARGWFKAYKALVPVVSIGNISIGGTGKTPVTINIARELIAQGKKVAILSRGFRRKSKGIVVVSDGKQLLCSVEQAGDEPYLIAQSVPQAVIIVSAQRAPAARMAIELYHCDMILLDDGFQHRAMSRNSDIVLVDYNHDLDKDCMFPAGTLREPLTELKRASAIVITYVPTCDFGNSNDNNKRGGSDFIKSSYDESPKGSRLQELSNTIAGFASDTPQYQCRFVPSRLIRVSSGQIKQLTELSESRTVGAVAFCGIARPQRFFDQLRALGIQIMVQQAYPDHYWYRDADVRDIKAHLQNSGSNLIVTTAKDAVRLQSMSGASRDILVNLPLWYLDMDVEWLSNMKSIASVYATLYTDSSRVSA